MGSAPDRPTLATVARHAGVSVASVSRVLNGAPASPDMAARVRDAAALVGYVPDAFARSLRAGRTDQLAFAVEDLGNPAYVSMMRAIERVTKQAGYRLLVHATESDEREEQELLRSVRHRYVDGLILCPIKITTALIDDLRSTPMPVVVIGTLPDDVPVDNVRADSRRGASLAVEHLASAPGVRTIALLNGPADTVPGSARHAGFLDATRDLGLVDTRIVMATSFGADAGRRAVDDLLADGRPDALLCANDLLALGALRRLTELGVRVPHDMLLAGMDDTDLARLSTPSLTSVSLAAMERGMLAGRMLIERLARPDLPPRRHTVPPWLIVRESSDRKAGLTVEGAA